MTAEEFSKLQPGDYIVANSEMEGYVVHNQSGRVTVTNAWHVHVDSASRWSKTKPPQPDIKTSCSHRDLRFVEVNDVKEHVYVCAVCEHRFYINYTT